MAKPPSPPPGAERRRHVRRDMMAEVELRRGGEVWLLPVLNVSLGGAFVERDPGDEPVLNTGDELEISLTDEDDEVITLSAKVIRVVINDEQPGLAVAWLSSDGALLARLGAFLDRP